MHFFRTTAAFNWSKQTGHQSCSYSSADWNNQCVDSYKRFPIIIVSSCWEVRFVSSLLRSVVPEETSKLVTWPFGVFTVLFIASVTCFCIRRRACTYIQHVCIYIYIYMLWRRLAASPAIKYVKWTVILWKYVGSFGKLLRDHRVA